MNIAEECKEFTSDVRITTSERGRKATFLNPEKHAHWKIRVDGCVVENALAADWVVAKIGLGDVVVELKGKDVEHATKQVHATAALWTREKLRQGRMAALIVATQYPRASTKVQKAKAAFAKRFGAPLHVVTHNAEYVFETVLSSRGPHGAKAE